MVNECGRLLDGGVGLALLLLYVYSFLLLFSLMHRIPPLGNCTGKSTFLQRLYVCGNARGVDLASFHRHRVWACGELAAPRAGFLA